MTLLAWGGQFVNPRSTGGAATGIELFRAFNLVTFNY